MNLNLDYLVPYKEHADIESLQALLNERNQKQFEKNNAAMLQAISNQPEIKAEFTDFSQDVISIGQRKEINEAQFTLIEGQLKTFSPWRKGPFNIFGIDIDAEWKSHLKWNRLAPHLDNLENKIICDLGCNNGYYMFKAAEQKPELVLGMDPTRKFKLAFHYLNGFAREPNLYAELLGFEDLRYFHNLFDTLFCMGILYHHENPMEILCGCHQAMKKGGQIIVETMGIASGEPLCLFPKGRYANMPNVWFIPSQSAVENMLHRAGFKNIQCIYNEVLSPDEQRKTAWANVESLADFLDQKNPRLTIEGYEAPSRIYFTARS